MKTSDDKSTDSSYVEVRDLLSCRTVEIEEDIMLHLDEDGQPVGYDSRSNARVLIDDARSVRAAKHGAGESAGADQITRAENAKQD